MHVLERAQAIAPYAKGKTLSDLGFGQEYMNWMPYGKFMPEKCVKCGCDRTHDQMYPPGRITPRAMCESCYKKWEQEIRSYQKCICGKRLPKEILRDFLADPYDLHNRFCSGKCADYFSLCSAYALGYDVWLEQITAKSIDDFRSTPEGQRLFAEICHTTPALPEPNHDPDVIDAEFEEIPVQKPFALPPPDDSLKVPSSWNRKTYRDKEVVFVPLKRR